MINAVKCVFFMFVGGMFFTHAYTDFERAIQFQGIYEVSFELFRFGCVEIAVGYFCIEKAYG